MSDDDLGPCPVCGTQMTDDYVFDGEDDRHVATCDICGWPPKTPHSVEEWRAVWRAKAARIDGGEGGG